MVTAFPFVGRAEERAALLERIATAGAGRGSLVLVGGEAGAGKTSLLSAVLAEDGALCVTGRCPGPDETPPFGPWAETVQKLHRDLGWETTLLPQPFGEAPGRFSTFELAGALAHWLGHRGQPVVLLIEDLHWADAASQELLRHLVPRLPDWPVLVIATYRTDELSRQHPLWHLLPELQRAGAARLLLDRLSAIEVAELMDRTLPPEMPAGSLAALVHARTAGLALFVREMLDLVIRTGQVPGPETPLPQTLQQAIDSKLDRLPRPALTALEAAAVIGERFSFGLLAQVGEMTEEELSEALEAAIARHIIRPQDTAGDWFAFDHALFRESLAARLIGIRRRRWHARIAAAMESGPLRDLDAITYHLARASDPRAVEYLRSAGDRARALGALTQARERYEQALALLPATHPDRPQLLLKLAWSLRWEDLARAGTICQEANEAAEAAGDRATALWARHLMLTLAKRGNDRDFFEQANAVIAAEEEMLNDPLYQRLEADLFDGLAGYPRSMVPLIGALALGGSRDQARLLVQHAASRALPAGSVEILEASVVLSLVDGRLAEAADQCARVVPVAVRHRNYRGAVRLQANELMIRLIGAADPPEELDLLAEMLRKTEEEAWKQSGYSLVKRGFSLTGVYQYFRGDWRGGYQNVVEAVRQDPNAYGGTLAWYAARILLSSGDPEGARPFAEAVAPVRPTAPVSIGNSLLVLVHALRAELCLALSETLQARVWLEAAERWPALPTAPFFRAIVSDVWAAYFNATGDPEGSWRAAEEALKAARAASSSFAAIQAHRRLGELAAGRGDLRTAQTHFQGAREIAERCRFPFEAALTRLVHGRSLDGPEAVAELETALAYFESVGAEPTAAMARRLLHRTEAPPDSAPQPAASVLPDGLTGREYEVVALVCQGLTDREIAARLFISPKTVDRHLRNIFNKTCVSNRAALATYAARQGLLP